MSHIRPERTEETSARCVVHQGSLGAAPSLRALCGDVKMEVNIQSMQRGCAQVASESASPAWFSAGIAHMQVPASSPSADQQQSGAASALPSLGAEPAVAAAAQPEVPSLVTHQPAAEPTAAADFQLSDGDTQVCPSALLMVTSHKSGTLAADPVYPASSKAPQM